jgi:hypothetical protein
LKDVEPKALCRLSRAVVSRRVKVFSHVPQGLLPVTTHFVAGRPPDLFQAILPRQNSRSSVLCDNHTKKRGAPALLLHATDNRANSLDGGR